jgi:hypothetical protein
MYLTAQQPPEKIDSVGAGIQDVSDTPGIEPPVPTALEAAVGKQRFHRRNHGDLRGLDIAQGAALEERARHLIIIPESLMETEGQ